MVEKQVKTWFRKAVFQWNLSKNDRKMPWKGEKDPYKIWLSEVMLQQTRVEQGIGYYNRFLERFPDVQTLAQSPDNQIFKLWEGLGYYSRCRNLIATARKVAFELKGEFPYTKEGLLALKGVGPYTAAAIGSFAFGLPLAVLDGNVFRVLARIFGIKQPIDHPKGRKLMNVLAQELLDESNPAAYNQAIMDFGAIVCKPQQPMCKGCPFQKKCIAFQEGIQSKLPLKSKKAKITHRYMYYLLLEHNGRHLIRERKGKDIWRGLHEFVLLEHDEPMELAYLKTFSNWGIKGKNLQKEMIDISDEIVHQLTHQKIHCRILHVKINQNIQLDGYVWKSKNAIRQLPFPRLITRYLGW